MDRHAVADLVFAWGSFIHACDMIARPKKSGGGLVVQLPNGDFRQSPWLAIKRRAINKIHRYLVQFGMTPISRKRKHGC